MGVADAEKQRAVELEQVLIRIGELVGLLTSGPMVTSAALAVEGAVKRLVDGGDSPAAETRGSVRDREVQWMRARVYWAHTLHDAIGAAQRLRESLGALDVRRTLIEQDVADASRVMVSEDVERMKQLHVRLQLWKEWVP